MIAKLEQVRTVTDMTALQQLKADANINDREQLSVVAEQFEAMMLQQILKNMRQANEHFSGDLINSQHIDFFNEMADQQLATNIASKGLGLADMLVQQLQKPHEHKG